jgi:acetyl esterase/lipase
MTIRRSGDEEHERRSELSGQSQRERKRQKIRVADGDLKFLKSTTIAARPNKRLGHIKSIQATSVIDLILVVLPPSLSILRLISPVLMKSHNMFKALTSQSFNVLWRTALLRLPRAVPTQVLAFTDPEGPYPFVIDLPSRGAHKIPIYVFLRLDILPSEAQNLPVILDFHGGGFFLGSCLEQAPFCSQMARELGAVVVSIDYRMGPVHKFPAAIEDGEDVLAAVMDSSSTAGVFLRHSIQRAILENMKKRSQDDFPEDFSPKFKVSDEIIMSPTIDLDTSRIAISGFSSGGNLALNLALSLNDLDPPWPSILPPDYQHPIALLLYYPSLDLRQLPSERPLPANMPTGSQFWGETHDLLTQTYLPRELAGHFRASPGLASSEALHDKARVLLVLPGMDSLAAQSEAWVEKLHSDGRGEHLQVERFPEMKHGWTQMPDGWLSDNERELKAEIFNKTVTYVRSMWTQVHRKAVGTGETS